MNKLSIVGAGMVGEAAAQIIAREEFCRELALIDVQGELAQGKALDVWQAAVESGSDTRVYGGANAELLQGSDLVVITAGVPRKPGQSRQDVLSTNLPILDGIMLNIKRHAPAATVLVVSNPVDVLTYRAWSLSGLGRDKVFGQAGVLDTARMKCFIAEATGFSARDITALVLGGHGDSMVPLMRYCTVGSVPLSHFLSSQQIEQIVQRTRQGGGVNTLTVHTNARSGPLADVQVRRALYQAINRDMLAERAYYGFGDPARGPIPAVIGWATDPEVDYREELPFDPQAAAEMLDAAGYPVGADGKRFSLDLVYISGYGVLEAASNVIKANLAEIGVDVSIAGNDFGLWSERTYTQHEFDMSIVFYTSYQDPSIGVARVYICNPDNVLFRNASGICDEEVDAAFAEAGSVPDLDARRAAFAKAESKILDMMHSYPLVDDPALHFGRGDRWDFSAAFENEPANWSLVKRIGQ